jgi:hypothetical protein
MTIAEVIANLEGYTLWDLGGYKLNKAEAECILKVLREAKDKEDEENA